MTTEIAPFHILTGSPGSGKTTLIEALARQINTVPEIARRVLTEQRAIKGTATGDQDPDAYVQYMLDMAVADYTAANGRTLFDRGIPDLLAYCAHYRLSDQKVCAAVQNHRYHSKVFVLPDWPEIYETDAERTLDFDGASAFGALTRAAYRQSGYTLVDVPKASVATRCTFILTNLET